MIAVLDTNVLLQARAAGHEYHPILQAWLNQHFTLAVSTEIMLEYEEVITARAGVSRWSVLERLIEISSNVLRVAPSFRFHLVTEDPDDDKFIDGAIAASADYVVTEDHHFESARDSGYRPQVISPREFMRLL
jgi:putative PIN family toxin of toxin-antitoxin system